ncbi:hypothetical protein T492DRAFT_1092286 [Pavlovales sp. CCMP2436]|nr:hypothetical protein T492DRAFT_1092286 [Pavlovales sp. CCMP2436]
MECLDWYPRRWHVCTPRPGHLELRAREPHAVLAQRLPPLRHWHAQRLPHRVELHQEARGQLGRRRLGGRRRDARRLLARPAGCERVERLLARARHRRGREAERLRLVGGGRGGGRLGSCQEHVVQLQGHVGQVWDGLHGSLRHSRGDLLHRRRRLGLRLRLWDEAAGARRARHGLLHRRSPNGLLRRLVHGRQLAARRAHPSLRALSVAPLAPVEVHPHVLQRLPRLRIDRAAEERRESALQHRPLRRGFATLALAVCPPLEAAARQPVVGALAVLPPQRGFRAALPRGRGLPPLAAARRVDHPLRSLRTQLLQPLQHRERDRRRPFGFGCCGERRGGARLRVG